MTRFLPAALAVAFSAATARALPPAPAHTLQVATEVLNDLAAIPNKGIPPALLNGAQGVAIVPRVIKAGFVVGGRGGHGVVLSRDRTGVWGDPVFVDLGGASVGFQAGVQSTDVVLVFKTRKSLDRILEGKGKVTLGADAAVAAGPVGRQAMAGTDAKLEAEIVSYSRSRGLFAGVALDGAVLAADRAANEGFARDPQARRMADALRIRLTEMSTVPAGQPATTVVVPGAVPPVVPQQMPARP